MNKTNMTETPITYDEFGPERVLEVWDPEISMRGFVVVDNTRLGPGKGGLRMTANVTLHEVSRLARTMTWKNALAGIPFGGAKSGIVWPPSFAPSSAEGFGGHSKASAGKGGDEKLKKRFIQRFARRVSPLIPKYYIAGPDVNTGEKEMQWFAEALGSWKSATGKPANYCADGFGKKCGIPHEFGSTGFGVVHATAAAARLFGVPLEGATIAIHGFGNVGTFAYKYLSEMGARVVGLADKSGLFYSKTGFTAKQLAGAIEAKQELIESLGKYEITEKEFWSLPVDILIPASVTDVIHEKNKGLVRAKIIIEAGNIPMRESIEKEFHKKGILVVPDFVANAGGVISSYAEYRGLTPKRMFELVEKKVVAATEEVVGTALKKDLYPRGVAMDIAIGKVRAGGKARS